jgi:hypothetical protein
MDWNRVEGNWKQFTGRPLMTSRSCETTLTLGLGLCRNRSHSALARSVPGLLTRNPGLLCDRSSAGEGKISAQSGNTKARREHSDLTKEAPGFKTGLRVVPSDKKRTVTTSCSEG